MDFISGKKSKNHKSKNQKFRIQRLGIPFPPLGGNLKVEQTQVCKTSKNDFVIF